MIRKAWPRRPASWRAGLPALAAVLLSGAGLLAQLPSDKLQELRKRYPLADADRNGTLTPDEARAYFKKLYAPGGRPALPRIAPTIENGSYARSGSGSFDFWQGRTQDPSPLVVYFHGGGFTTGGKNDISPSVVGGALDRGFAVMSVSYPFLADAPIQEILPACARAVQFARRHARDWNIDPKRIACMGLSAGGGVALWIAVHPDLAEPDASDPVARESTRIQAAAMLNGQATYDILRWKDLIGPADERLQNDPSEGPRFYHLASPEEMASPAGAAIRAGVDMYGLLDRSDPPVFLFSNTVVKKRMDRGTYLHHPRHAQVTAEKAASLGVTHRLMSGEAARGKNGATEALDFFQEQLIPTGNNP